MSTTKKYWQSLEQLHDDPAFVEQSQKEFAEPIPVDEFLGKTDLDEATTTRRDFLKYMGFSLGAATLAACETPVIKSVPYLNKPEEINPGIPNYYATTYADGVDFASILVKTREGRPIHIEGNPECHINGGAVSARINSSVLSLYDTSRMKGPWANGGETHWSEIDKTIFNRLNGAKNIRILTHSVMSPSTKAAVAHFASKFGGTASASAPAQDDANNGSDSTAVAAAPAMAPSGSANVRHITYDAVSYSGMIEANEAGFGKAAIPTYHFDKAKVIVSIDADFLGNWLNGVQNTHQFGKTRRPEGPWMSRHYQFETNLSLTGSNADVRGAIKPSEVGKTVAALHTLVTGGGKIDVSAENGVNDKIKNAAAELKANEGNSLVVSGSNDANVQLMVNAINAELGNYGNTINLEKHSNLAQGRDSEVAGLISEMVSGSVDALIIMGCNPMYTMPAAWGFAEALGKVKTSISLSTHLDETAAACGFVCPTHHYLESWGDAEPEAGHYTVVQPTIKNLYNTRQAESSLLTWAAGGEEQSFHAFMQNYWETNMFPTQSKFSNFTKFWNQSVHDGVFTASHGGMMHAEPAADAAEGEEAVAAPAAMTFNGNVGSAAAAVNKVSGGEWELNLYVKTSMGIGNQANNPWLQELPDPVSRVVWDNYITMNPLDMKDKGFNIGIAEKTPAHKATVTVGDQSITLPVFPIPGQRRNTVGIALGYGRTAVGKIGGVGANAFPMVSDSNGNLLYAAYDVKIEGTGETYQMASLQTHGTMMGRKIVNETVLDTYKNTPAHNPGAQGPFKGWNQKITLKDAYGNDTPVSDLNLWDDHAIELGHRWGMVIDLNSCTGCGACVTACTSENNVPVVGKDEIRRTRSMFWLRIDRYYSSSAGSDASYTAQEVPSEYPEVTFQPVMCQHCNHAPCETVCPVAATTHSLEGLNQMAYNRCVGTRYCANNCPYKVRRFNWFNYTGYKKFKDFNPSQSEMGRMVLNPDVTVRSRGVMEKCSFCVQRIQAAKLQAKKDGKKIADDGVKPACGAACPTHAISFGDVNEAENSTRKLANDDRSYHLLEEVGTQPNVWYMTKVWNRTKADEPKAEEAAVESDNA